MRASRLLSIVLLLQIRGRLSTRQLAEQLDVSPRTIHRDMDALSGAGVPVFSERGRDGGWALVEGYRTQLTGLTEPQIQALFLNPSENILRDLGLQAEATNALLKVIAALPHTQRAQADVVQERILITTPTWHKSTETTSCLPLIQAALWQSRQLAIHYRRGDGEHVKRTVHPLGLVAKGSTWYCVATCDDDVRTYRVSRVLAAAMLDMPAQRPPNFDLATYWDTATQTFIANLPRYPATLRVQKEAVHYLENWRWAKIVQLSEPDADGWHTAEIEFEVFEEAVQCVLGLGTAIQVIEPHELQQAVIERAQAVVAQFASET